MMFADLMPLFAQAGRMRGAGGPNDADAAAAAGSMMCVFGVILVLSLAASVLAIMLLVAMYKALSECAPENRTMEPIQVWFTFIPLVGVVFFIMAFFKVPDSLANEYRARGMRGDGDFGKSSALWSVLGYFLCAPVGLVFWVIFMRKLFGYVKELQGGGSADDDDRPARKRPSKYADDDDDRPRKRRRDDDDDDDDDDDRPRKRRRDDADDNE
ncbi:MAG: hypothetical protein MUF18_14305 [Fimbriiglobus sp.]|jgi:hypothetical protein|nr:hypothetical protein [Fimbriiglobus sp.]